ncbi:MAG TPA: HAD-IA family hydrolase [Rhodocyclaceae bacterium]|nr:HAD-IA family hydrolase [Rhodocyclaceae bacterium]
MRDGKTRAVFFDLDGTLADTAPDLGGALNELLEEFGRIPLDRATLRPHVSAGTRGMLGIGFGLMPDDSDYPNLAKRFLDLYAARLCKGTRLFNGMAPLLDHLDEQGILWGIVTNKPARFTLPLADCLQLSGRAAAIISGDSTSRPKPAPDSLLLACEQAGVSPSLTLYVGDDLRDVQAAHAAGMPAVAAAWGYLGDGPAIDEWNADATIAGPLELLNLL